MLENGETPPDMNSHKPTKTGSKFYGLVEKHGYFTMSVKNIVKIIIIIIMKQNYSK